MKFHFIPNFVLILAMLCGASAAQASWNLSQTVVEKENQIQILNTLTCTDKKSDLCVSLCQSSSCEWVEPSCRDCLGTGSEVLRDVFTRLTSTYKSESDLGNSMTSTAAFSTALRSTPLILLGDKSPYDFFNSSQDSEFRKSLESACGSQNGFIAVTLDEESRPLAAVFAICPSRIVRLLK